MVWIEFLRSFQRLHRVIIQAFELKTSSPHPMSRRLVPCLNRLIENTASLFRFDPSTGGIDSQHRQSPSFGPEVGTLRHQAEMFRSRRADGKPPPDQQEYDRD